VPGVSRSVVGARKRVRLNLSPHQPLRNRLTALDSDGDAVPATATATTYTYDANGSQITITQSAATTYYLWDLRNRMAGISLDNDGNATDPNETTYAYDSNAVRVSQITYATPTNSAIVYLNDANNPTGYTKALEKKTGTSVSAAASSTPTTTYVLGLRVEGQKDSTSTVWFERDGHGSNRGLIETNGTVSASYDYNAFGDPIGFTPATARTIELFGGDGVYDAATGWTYHLARWRNGFRFTSFDSYMGDTQDPQSLHKYLYANANPIMGIDPTGQFVDTLVTGLIWAGEFAQEVGKASMVVGIAGFVASLATFYGASRGLSLAMDAGDLNGMVKYMNMQSQAEQGMRISGYLAAGGAMAYVAGTVMLGAAAMLATVGGSRAGAFDFSKAGHIFRNSPGHVNPSSLASQQRYAALFERVASNSANLRTDAVRSGIMTQDAANAGSSAYTWIARNGEQVWVIIRNGVIQNAGVNPPGAVR
jgi:hypothetical protein